MKKYLKKTVLFLVLCVIFINSSSIATVTGIDSTGAELGLGSFEQYAQKQGSSTKFNTKVDVILGVFQIVGSLLSVICLIILGIKYMMGSVEEKAEYKKTLLPYVLGAVMVLGISNVINLIYKVTTGIF